VLIDNYIEYDGLQNSASSKEVIEKLKRWFAVHGQPQQVYSDNGPQYSSILNMWPQVLSTRSRMFWAERAVQIVKRILKKCKIDGSATQYTTGWPIRISSTKIDVTEY
jgi:hypothetical protein